MKTQTGGRSMKHYLNTLLVLAFCILFASLSAHAEQKNQGSPTLNLGAPAGSQPISPSAVPAQPGSSMMPAIKVLQYPLLINEAMVFSMSLYNSLLVAIDRVQNAYSPLKFSDCPSDWFGLEETYYGGYKTYIKTCANKSYSVQDQQNAGCLGSDTVDQCTNKLFRHCLSRYEQEKNSHIKTKITDGIAKSDKIRNEAKELSDALKTLKNLMP